MATVKRERTTPSPPKAAPTGRSVPLANAEIEAPPAITAEVIKPVSTMPMIVFNRFFFFAYRLRVSISVNFLTNMPAVLMVLKGLNLYKFWFHCRIYSWSLLNS